MAEEKEDKKEDKKAQAIIDEAAKAYGIAPEFILSSKYYPETGEAVIATHGGAKVRFCKGDKPDPLDPVQVDGIIRKKPRFITGKKGKKAEG